MVMKFLVFVLTLFPVNALPQSQVANQHEHGQGRLAVSFSEAGISISLVVPGLDVLGFEGPAETEGDQASVAGAISELSNPLDLFSLSEEAGCFTVSANVTLSGEGLGPVVDNGSNVHTEFRADYQMQCQDMTHLDHVTFPYFDRFQRAESLIVQIEKSGKVDRHTVTRDAPDLDLNTGL